MESTSPSAGTAPPQGLIFYTFDGVEHREPVPRGADRWDAVAEALARRLRCRALAEEPPSYDTGTRSWTLPVTLRRRLGRTETLLIPVRW
ncbi:hypothetical protein [Roseomonas indoligenes]|uniref:Uncharacterized protein n=1 Tax=Roseomonas indoligenes TaxID=2820811 RepID=A0A940N5R2_9PROT|nr:hypothetical protein [Pararoseomonas indoligenes]MBP0494647.1 hypothetical protein [Pararoseomonas indoligenes]